LVDQLILEALLSNRFKFLLSAHLLVSHNMVVLFGAVFCFSFMVAMAQKGLVFTFLAKNALESVLIFLALFLVPLSGRLASF
jgi:hypothetical protein